MIRFRKFSLLRRRYHCGKISCGYGSNIGVLKEQGKKRRAVNILPYNDILNRIPRCFSPLTPKKEEKKFHKSHGPTNSYNFTET